MGHLRPDSSATLVRVSESECGSFLKQHQFLSKNTSFYTELAVGAGFTSAPALPSLDRVERSTKRLQELLEVKDTHRPRVLKYGGTALIRKRRPPRTIVGPEA